MEKTYKDLHTLTEIAQAMDAGKHVDRRWNRGNICNTYFWKVIEGDTHIDMFDWEYRTVEETELPEQGDEIMVWDLLEEGADTRKFVCFWEDQVIAVNRLGDVHNYPNWKPIDKKPMPKEGWIHPDALAPVRDCSGLIHVREVLEDE